MRRKRRVSHGARAGASQRAQELITIQRRKQKFAFSNLFKKRDNSGNKSKSSLAGGVDESKSSLTSNNVGHMYSSVPNLTSRPVAGAVGDNALYVTSHPQLVLPTSASSDNNHQTSVRPSPRPDPSQKNVMPRPQNVYSSQGNVVVPTAGAQRSQMPLNGSVPMRPPPKPVSTPELNNAGNVSSRQHNINPPPKPNQVNTPMIRPPISTSTKPSAIPLSPPRSVPPQPQPRPPPTHTMSQTMRKSTLTPTTTQSQDTTHQERPRTPTPNLAAADSVLESLKQAVGPASSSPKKPPPFMNIKSSTVSDTTLLSSTPGTGLTPLGSVRKPSPLLVSPFEQVKPAPSATSRKDSLSTLQSSVTNSMLTSVTINDEAVNGGNVAGSIPIAKQQDIAKFLQRTGNSNVPDVQEEWVEQEVENISVNKVGEEREENMEAWSDGLWELIAREGDAGFQDTRYALWRRAMFRALESQIDHPLILPFELVALIEDDFLE